MSTQTTETSPETTTVYTMENRTGLYPALESGARCEVDREVYFDFMEVLPPRIFNKYVTVTTGETVLADFGFAEGDGVTIVAFWNAGSSYYAQNTTLRTRG